MRNFVMVIELTDSDAYKMSDGFAKYLIQEKLLLTGLEYHYELLERGITNERLNDFFSNPQNFSSYETCVERDNSLTSFVSMSTLDSFDFHGETEERTATEDQLKVLEFELRKKNEELRCLRERITNSVIPSVKTSGAENHPVNGCSLESGFEMQAHESRTLRFLINEHLLNSGFKLTSVQFSEECESEDQQDLDDWDDVGLSYHRPPDLVTLLRQYWINPVAQSSLSTVTPTSPTRVSLERKNLTVSIAAQTEASSSQPLDDLEACHRQVIVLQCNQDALKAELEVTRQQLADCRGQHARFEAEKLSLSQESTYWRNQLLCLKRDHPDLVGVSSVARMLGRSPSDRPPAGLPSSGSAIDSPDIHPCSPENIEAGVSAVEKKPNESSPAPNPPSFSANMSSPSIRRTSPEFLRCAMQMLFPSVLSDDICAEFDTFRLADSMDEIIILIGSQIESILDNVPENHKSVALPLLLQVICLHPDSLFRDRLLRRLFNLFSPSADKILTGECQSAIILHHCRLLAISLGPQRIESELLPQIWSQLNERPTASLRTLLILACGFISPATPSRLRSSLLFSVLRQAIEEEKDDFVRATAIRSLACLVSLMEDPEKLSLLSATLDQLIFNHTCIDASLPTCCPPRLIETAANIEGENSAAISKTHKCLNKLSFGAAYHLLIPTLAEWSLETNELYSRLVDPWLSRLESLFVDFYHDQSDSESASAESVRFNFEFRNALAVVEHLLPFVFAQLMLSSESPDFNCEIEEQITISCEDVFLNGETLFDPKVILGIDTFSKLKISFNVLLSHSRTDFSIPNNSEQSDTNSLSDTSHLESRVPPYASDWVEMNFFKNNCLLRIAKLLRGLKSPRFDQGREIPSYLEPDVVSLTEFLSLMQSQFEDSSWLPWQLSHTSSEICIGLDICHFVTVVGRIFGSLAVRRHLAEPFQSLLMEKSLQGYAQFDLKAMPSAVFAGFTCLLASTNEKSEFNQVKMLITNAIFLHSRDFCSLHGLRFALMSLCFTNDPWVMARDIILPSLRSCASCADPSVRRTATSIFNCLLGCLSLKLPESVAVSSSILTMSVIEECWQLASQLVRDDYTAIGANVFPNEECELDCDSADWACIACALAPLFSLYSRLLRPNIYATDADLKRKNMLANCKITDQILKLLAQIMSMVSMDPATPLDSSVHHFLTQRPHWETLVVGLLQVINRLFPTCCEEFRDSTILPWLYRLTEINNTSPDREQRSRLGKCLISVFSTAAFCLGNETAIATWVMPGLDRLRLDFVEAGERDSADELEQLSADLRQRLVNHPPIEPRPRSIPGSGLKGKFSNTPSSSKKNMFSFSKKK